MTNDDLGDDRLMEFVDGALDATAAAEVRRRIDADPSALQRVRELEAVDRLLGVLPSALHADLVASRAMKAARARSWRLPFPPRWRAVAAAVLVVAIGAWGYLAHATHGTPAAGPGSEDEPLESSVARVVAGRESTTPEALREVAATLDEIDAIQSNFFGSD